MVDEEGKINSTNKLIKMKKIIEEENAQETARKIILQEKKTKAQKDLKTQILDKVNRNWNIAPLKQQQTMRDT